LIPLLTIKGNLFLPYFPHFEKKRNENGFDEMTMVSVCLCIPAVKILSEPIFKKLDIYFVTCRVVRAKKMTGSNSDYWIY
jgi:hypothetical protein